MSDPTLYIGIVELERTGPCSGFEELSKCEMTVAEFAAMMHDVPPANATELSDEVKAFNILREAIALNGMESAQKELDDAVAGESYARIDVSCEDGPWLYIGLDKGDVYSNMIGD